MAARLLVFAVMLCGCAETLSPDALPPVQANAQMYPPVDTFWLQQEVAAMREPKPLPVRSISLGYIGDAPLSGGVMRDTPTPNRAVYIDEQQPQQPCACALRPE